MSLYPLQSILTNMMKNNTPSAQHSNTWLYFGTKQIEDFRDVLRIHNVMTCYIFLIDSNGRIRFTGSGPASTEEVTNVIQFAKELSRTTNNTTTRSNNNRSTIESRGSSRRVRGVAVGGGGGGGGGKSSSRRRARKK